jgi:hypothetical protein
MTNWEFSLEEAAAGKRICWAWALRLRDGGLMDVCGLWHGYEAANDERFNAP